jgi:hypothetical protein
MEQIVDFCGGRKREVLNYIAAYQDMEEHYRNLVTSDDQFDPRKFSAFVEVQNPRVRNSILTHKFTMSDFSKWVMDGLISPLDTVRRLPQILDNPRSRAVFLRSGAQEALKVIDVQVNNVSLKDVVLKDLAREVSKRVLNMAYSELQRLRVDIGGDENAVLLEARDNLTVLCKDITAEE